MATKFIILLLLVISISSEVAVDALPSVRGIRNFFHNLPRNNPLSRFKGRPQNRLPRKTIFCNMPGQCSNYKYCCFGGRCSNTGC
ncbi:hypothetical protein ACHQM5_006446 [Ranunculus cassubicifolius]